MTREKQLEESVVKRLENALKIQLGQNGFQQSPMSLSPATATFF